MNRTVPTHTHALQALEALESRFGTRVAVGLNERIGTLPHDVTERLRFGRDNALHRLRDVRARERAAAGGLVRVGRGQAALLGSGLGLQLASWAPLILLIAGLLLIQQWTGVEQVLAAAEIDAVLLADELPPAAWADPGFREFLKSPLP